MKPLVLALVLSVASAGAVERVTFDSAGALTRVIDHGVELPAHGHLVAYFEGDVRVSLQPHDQRTPITRENDKDSWAGEVTCPNGAAVKYTATWRDTAEGSAFAAEVAPQSLLQVEALDYVLDLPRKPLVGARVTPGDAVFAETKPADATFFRQTVDRLKIAAADQSWTIELKLDRARAVTLTDAWDQSGRYWRLRISLGSGLLRHPEKIAFAYQLSATAQPKASAATVTVDPSKERYPFDGFGGNYCFGNDSPVVEYTMEALKPAWVRMELKAMAWDLQRAAPGPELQRDFQLMQRVQQSGAPWIVSVWRIPERFYLDPNQKPMTSFGRRIAGERWPEFLDLLGSYLVYLKKHYNAEPDYFSFNEPDLGVNVGFSAELHREAIKRIGAHFVSLGLKTKMLLGDTANPRDSHNFTLATAADAEAMKYVGAVSFHSWNSGTPAQYGAWADVAHWLKLPLIVGEAGTDPGAYRNRTFDSYAYGLREAEQFQQLLRDATPVSLLYWEYNEDYGLVRKKSDGKIEPTGRFWLMKQFGTLTPAKSQVVQSASDNPEVLVSAFAKNGKLVAHVLNLGPERDVSVVGLQSGSWKRVVTTEAAGFQEQAPTQVGSTLHLPARSLTTLIQQ